MIKNDSKVTMHFTLKLMDGSVADSTKMRGEPAVVLMGDGTLSQAMEEHLLGLEAGSKKQFTLAPEDAVGMPNPNNIHVMPRSHFSENEGLEEGVIFSFTQPNGSELPGIIRKVEEDNITVDFNHPLAGQALLVEVEITSVAS